MPCTVRGISLYMGPQKLGAKDDLESAIVGFIKAAKETLDVAVQELESDLIAEALVEARKNGVKVRLVLEGDYLGVDRPQSDPFKSGGKERSQSEDPCGSVAGEDRRSDRL